MENGEITPIPQCYVVVHKLTMEEISRITINPLSIIHKCGKCKERVFFGPKCSSCEISYHYNCALICTNCCGIRLLFEENLTKSKCRKCSEIVEFGPQCKICKSKFHSFCISPFEQCCQLNVCERKKVPSQCGKCSYNVDLGPKCPLCMKVYHASCIGEVLECCGVKLVKDEIMNFKCKRCKRKIGKGSLMCQLCGSLIHGYCIRDRRFCCGRRIPLDVYLIPNYKYMINFYTHFERRRAALKKLEEMVRTHTHKLRSMNGKLTEALVLHQRAKTKKKKSVSSQTNVLENISIVEVKTELEQKELDIPESPPHLEREDIVYTPEPSSSSSMMPEIHNENEESLKNLFDFLYNMVKKFPPPLQTQVKIDLFKTVTEAEMKLQCNMFHNNSF